MKTSVEHRLDNQIYVSPRESMATFAEVANRWARNPSWKDRTRERNLSILKHHLLPRWGNWKLRDIKHDDIQDWVAAMCAPNASRETPLAARTVQKYYSCLRSILALAVRTGRLPANPAQGVQLPRARPVPRRFLTATQVRQLADGAGRHGLTITTAAYTGLRFGELAGLQWHDVNWETGRLSVTREISEHDDGTLHIDTLKTYANRTIKLPQFLLQQLHAASGDSEPYDLVFPDARGGPMRRSNFLRDVWKPSLAAAGIPTLNPHALRHTAASLAISSGANVLAVRNMLGHKDASVTLNDYADLFDTDMQDVAERMNALYEGTHQHEQTSPATESSNETASGPQNASPM